MMHNRAVFVVVPVKDPAFGKTRLAPLMTAVERRALCLSLAKRTLQACAAAFGPAHTIVVTSGPEIARLAGDGGMQVVAENPGNDDLNQAIRLGMLHAQSDGGGALMVVPADLALITVPELLAAANAIPPAAGCLIVPDRRGSGTNVLGLTPIRADLVAFGEGSFERHARLARRAGYEVRIHRSAALALDLDLPEDYLAWRGDSPPSLRRTEASAPGAHRR